MRSYILQIAPGHSGGTDLCTWTKNHVQSFGDGSPLLQLALIYDGKVAAKVFGCRNHKISNFSGRPIQIKIIIYVSAECQKKMVRSSPQKANLYTMKER